MQTLKAHTVLLVLFWLYHPISFAQNFLQIDIAVENQEKIDQIETKLQQYHSKENVSIYAYLLEDTQGAPLATYTRELANDLGVTAKSLDSTILVVIDAQEKKGYIKSSGGLRHLLTRTVLREMMATNPYLEEGKYLESIDILTNDLILTIHPYYEVSDIPLDDTENISETDDEFQEDDFDPATIPDEMETTSPKTKKKEGMSLAGYLLWAMGTMMVGILGYAFYYFNKINQDNMQENMTLDSFGSIGGNAMTNQEYEELDLENFQGGGVEGSW